MFKRQVSMRTFILFSTGFAVLGIAIPARLKLPFFPKAALYREVHICFNGPTDSSSLSTILAGGFNQSVSEFMDGTESDNGGGLCIATQESVSGSANQNTTIAGALIQGTGRRRPTKRVAPWSLDRQRVSRT